MLSAAQPFATAIFPALVTKITWVKNVHSLCVQSGKFCGYSYTGSNLKPTNYPVIVVKPQTYTRFPTSFTPALFTAIFSHLYLLIHHLYTLSTAPIIKTKKIN